MVKTIGMKVIAAIILFCGMFYSCVGGCKVTYEYFAVVTNALDTPVTIEFGFHRDSKTILYFTETLNASETKETHVVTVDTRNSTKAGNIDALCGSDEQKHRNAMVVFSNNTLGQYTICAGISYGPSSESVITYQVLASNATCTAPYPSQETFGW